MGTEICVNVFAGGRNWGIRWVAAGIRRRNYSLLGGRTTGYRQSRMESQHANRGRVETNRGAKGQRVGGFVIEHDAASVGAGSVGQDADGRFQPVREVQVGGCGAIDPVERGEPWQGGVAYVRSR
jgi:hypothetical protein